ncbi:hypothetical protein MMC10_000634 [Thelotrema lepadinum]|nr:hypothetical protein [Thelotrema lepadinum]
MAPNNMHITARPVTLKNWYKHVDWLNVTDTEKDPYSVRKGLIYSHVGWLVMKQDPKRAGRTDISDLDADPVVVWQRRYYIPLVAITAWVFPSLVAALCWGDWLGGLVYAGVLRMFFVQQATFCVNSIAHYLGDQPFDDRHSPRDHFITALLTLGEGWHNFHHEFLSDWRNGIHWHQYDPTKRAIFVFKAMGLAHDLKAFPSNEIKKGQVQQAQKKLDRQRAGLDWGALVAIAGVIHDISDFISQHPGGRAMIMSGIGKDATAMFNGGIYDHSNAAHNLLSSMRVGIIRGGGEVEIRKHIQVEDKSILRAGLQVTQMVDSNTSIRVV